MVARSTGRVTLVTPRRSFRPYGRCDMKSINLILVLVLVSFLFVSEAWAEGCCLGRVGNANGEGGDEPTIGDVSLLIDGAFVSASVDPLLVPPACIEEADINLSGLAHWPPVYDDITIGDISALIDALFITADLSLLPDCPFSSGPAGEIVDHSSCKSHAAATADNEDCLVYSYDGVGRLSLNHVNAGFNCCPVIAANISVEGEQIIIEELDSLDNGGCLCLCLFDVNYEIIGLIPGNYRISVIEPYAGGYDPPLEFWVDLSGATSGQFCVPRTTYPWAQ